VEVAAAVGNRWRIASGLQAGDRVVVDGLQRVRPGDNVKETEVDPATLGGGKRSGKGGGGDKPAGDKAAADKPTAAAQGAGASAPAAR